eukprot:CAMPEP_0205820368 /NCGR_PEP_ID=MMETSP0206-20130828/2989_1 /ASSEMBLY_ACC=CAM_ASM_000279 /TAXON_ID=36767 /ORGANISM="Euplotes focardii, Strain TN1" /LENGTH=269 /DNA_ID=CAMNT_0053114993 /DNA_START=23 /DNA_END=832 /DNA_ORIENTATION=+
MNCFDLPKLVASFKNDRNDLVFMARTAEAAERYEDMCAFMKQLVETTDKNGVDLTVEERNLLSVAYKNVVGARRASFRTLNVSASETKDDEHDLVVAYRKQIEEELNKICKEVLGLLEGPLVKNSDTSTKDDKDESRVFYLKMAGDYYRYMSEFVDDKLVEEKSGEFYKKAMEIAEEHLEPTHPIRLGLALNYSVCFYEILKNKKKACDLAKSAFDLAIAGLDKLPEASYKDSTLIMQLLRDNLTLWTSSENEDSTAELAVEDVEDAES